VSRQTVWSMALVICVAACSVPRLDSLGEKRCDVEHPCIDGYACQSGVCKVPTGTPCTPGQTKTCGSAVGTCVAGTQRCVDGVFGECEGATGPVTESCDGKDNDCNGQSDDHLDAGSPCELQTGVCAGKTKRCVGGAFVAACGASEYGSDYQPAETRCDGQDNDCDGMTDEGVNGGACPAVGVCVGGSRACVNGMPGACMVANYEPLEVSCDNLDNDCDGMTDEGLVSSTACARSVGVCSGAFAVCRDGSIEAVCTSASYGVNFEPSEASCDGLDNDCDGVVDRQPDGGFLRRGVCELAQGVCAGAQRVCLGGNGEAPCTAASYGSTFEAVEASCDGLDNDCDGRVDVSREASLLLTPNASSNHLSLAANATGGSAAVYVDQRRGAARIFFRRFDDALRPLTNEFELSDANTSGAMRPSIVRLGSDFAVVWIEAIGGSSRIVLARLSAAGTVAWSRVVATGVSVFKDPRVAASAATNAAVAVAWIGSDLVIRGGAWDGSNIELAPVRQLVAGPDAGGDLVFGMDLVRRTSSNDFLMGWVAQSNGFKVRFQVFNNTLNAQGTLREESAGGETADYLRVVVAGDTGEVAGAWLGSSGGTTSLRWLPNALSSPTNLVASAFTGTSSDLSLAPLPAGVAAFWVEGLPTARLVGLQLGGDAGARDFTPQGVTGLFAPGVASLDGGVLHVGYEADRGTGLDLFGQVVCRP
jgi:hypothetical protein